MGVSVSVKLRFRRETDSYFMFSSKDLSVLGDFGRIYVRKCVLVSDESERKMPPKSITVTIDAPDSEYELGPEDILDRDDLIAANAMRAARRLWKDRMAKARERKKKQAAQKASQPQE